MAIECTRAALIQASNAEPADSPLEQIKQAMIDKHIALIARGRGQGRPGVLPAGDLLRPLLLRRAGRPLVRADRADSRRADRSSSCRSSRRSTGMVMVVPIYEVRDAGRLLQHRRGDRRPTATYLGKYRKHHIPHCHPGFWEKFYFKPGNLGYPVFETRVRPDRRVHLLRPPLPRGRPRARAERRGDRLQPLGHRGRAERVPVEARAARARGGEPVLRRRHQPRRHARRRGTSASSTARATSAIRAARSSPRRRATRTRWSSPISIST